MAEANRRESALEPELEVVDAHHHLWSKDDERSSSHREPYDPNREPYDQDDLRADLRAAHVVGTVFVDCSSHYREDGPAELAPAGETEWVMSQRTGDGVMEAIVSFADMYLGDRAAGVLEAHLAAGDGAFKGIRHSVAWDASPNVNNAIRGAPEHALLDPQFQAGVKELGKRGLLFETWCYFHQLPEVAALAGTFPDLTIVVDHLGGPAVIGPYAGNRAEMLEEWRKGVRALADHENVYLKLGGIGYKSFVEPAVLEGPRTSEWLARYWSPEILFCIETLGPDRCMFESNFPVDRPLCDYVTLWNTFKRIAADLDEVDRGKVLAGTARRAYTMNGGPD